MKKAFLLCWILLCSVSLGIAQSETQTAKPEKVYWTAGGESSKKIYVDGLLVERIHDGNIVVAMTLSDNGKYLESIVSVFNRTGHSVDVLPTEMQLYAVEQKRRLKSVAPQEVASAIQKSAKWQSLIVGLSAMGQTKETRTTGKATSTIRMSDLDGNVVDGTVKTESESKTVSPDRDATRRAESRVNDIVGAARSQINSVEQVALRNNTVPDKSDITGVVFFEREKKRKTVLAKVPVNGKEYIFEFAFQ